jgi:starvation-inducible DNA-binding protein
MVIKMAKIQSDKTTACYCYLVQCLRDSVHVYSQTQLVHWGLMGGKFYSIHKLTQKIYEEMQEGIDTIAEHIRSLDISTPKTVEDLVYSNMPGVPLDNCFDQEAIIRQLATNHNLLAEKFQELAQTSEAIGDQLTLDLAVERGRAHKKFQWLLKSTLDYKK